MADAVGCTTASRRTSSRPSVYLVLVGALLRNRLGSVATGNQFYFNGTAIAGATGCHTAS